jgi:hypothetical protein
MNSNAFLHTPSWTTASFSDAADTTPMELRDMAHHLQRCGAAKGRLFHARCAADWVHGLVAPRLVTTLVLLGFITAVGWMFL